MFRTDVEMKVGRHCFIEGMTQEEAAAASGVTQGRVSQIRAMLLRSLDQLGINTKNPAEVSSAVGAILARAERRHQDAA